MRALLTLVNSLCSTLLIAAEPLALKVTKTKETIEVKAGDLIVTKYHFGEKVAKPYFYPLNTPQGTPVTRGWPMVKGTTGETTDHIHQKSMWFCHGDVIPEGLELKVRSADKRVEGVDFWSEAMNHGKMVCTKVGEPLEHSKPHWSVTTSNEWRTPDNVKIMDEERKIHFVSTEKGFLIHLEIDLHASVYPITFGDTKEGSFGVRVHDALRGNTKDGGTITSAKGDIVPAPSKDNLVMWGKSAAWHDYSGKVDGKEVGLAMFEDQKNPHLGLWHTRAYGLMAVNPFGREKSGFPEAKGKTELVKLKKGEHLKLRYAVYAHDGDAKASGVADAFKAFAGK